MLAKCCWAKEMTLDGNLNPWNICRELKRVNNKVNIINSVNINLFSLLSLFNRHKIIQSNNYNNILVDW